MTIIPHTEIPPRLREVLMSSPDSMTSSPMANAALAYRRAGFGIVPVQGGTKRIDKSSGFNHGHAPRLPSYEDAVTLWVEEDPDRNIGLVPDTSTIIVDVDTKNGARLSDVEKLGLAVSGVYREQTPSGGFHLYYVMPNGAEAAKSAMSVAPGIDLIGPTSFALVPHSVINGTWYRADPSHGWSFGRIPDGWAYLPKIRQPVETRIGGPITLQDKQDANALIRRLRGASTFKLGIDALFGKDFATVMVGINPGLDTSESGRDFFLVYEATALVRTHPRRREVLFALLWETGWPRSLTRRSPKSNPEAYCWRTVDSALEGRDAQYVAKIASFAGTYVDQSHVWSEQDHLGPPPLGTPTLIVPKFEGRNQRGQAIDAFIMRFAGWRQDDEYTREDGWRRLPVDFAAGSFGVTPEAIRLHLVSLAERTSIARKNHCEGHDGARRRDSLVRLIKPVDRWDAA